MLYRSGHPLLTVRPGIERDPPPNVLTRIGKHTVCALVPKVLTKQFQLFNATCEADYCSRASCRSI